MKLDKNLRGKDLYSNTRNTWDQQENKLVDQILRIASLNHSTQTYVNKVGIQQNYKYNKTLLTWETTSLKPF